MKIIGIAGTIGSGKGTVVEYLTQCKDFAHYSSSGTLVELLEERGEFVDRDAMNRIADELRANRPGGVLAINLERAQKDKHDHVILEAIHSSGEADCVRAAGGIILGVDADVKIRYDRVSQRGTVKDDISFEKFLEQHQREDKGSGDAHKSNILEVIETADYTVTNDGTLEELHAQLDEIVKQIDAA